MKNRSIPILLALWCLWLAGSSKTSGQTLNLPAPFFLETFDQVEEGSLPTGWTVQNFTAPGNEELNLDDPHSDSYKDWVVISRDRVVAIGEAGGFNAGHRLGVKPGQIVNGVEITNLVNGKFIYAESDVRGGSQVQYLFTRDIDCTGKTNVYLSYHSIYTQNQDDIASVEYSIDGGATWLPVVYMIDTPDIKYSGTNIDAYTTLISPQTDTATYTDPNTGEDKGGYYGAFIGVTSNLWSTLAPFISARVDDDAIESKRVEFFPLPQAANQSKVRLRFAQAGTASWYFGLDDVGLYNIEQSQPPNISQSPLSQIVSAGATITLNVVATGSGLTYQWKHAGTNLVGQTAATLTLSNVSANDAGEYQAIVSSVGGSSPSGIAKIQVFSGAITQDLVVHLPFENNLDDKSGKGNNGTALGSTTFNDGKIGKAAHIPSGADYITLGAPADLNFSTNVDFTITFWAKATEWSGDPSFIGNKNWNSGGNPGYVLATDDDGHFQWNFAGPPGSRKDYDGPPGLFSDHNWHHIAVTFQRSGDATAYVDGQSVSTRALSASENDVNTPEEFATNIGQDGTGGYGSSFTDADIDDVGIWRRVLTGQEVAAIYNAGLVGTNLAQATVSAPAIAPTITAQPQNVSITAGATATLSVTAQGSQPLSYQWVFNGTNIAGATTSTLTLNNVQTSNNGTYAVIVSNAGGSITSSNATLTVNVAAPSVVTGQWDFNEGNLKATIGTDLEYRGDTAAGTTFTDAQIGGQPAKVMGFPGTTTEQGYVMHHGASANAGGTNVNQFTIIMDLMYPAESDSHWRALLQTDPTNASDGDLFFNNGNGLGISGQYQGTIAANTWTRVAVVFDLTAKTLKKYIDGNLVNVQALSATSGGVDQRWSLLPTALLFADEDGETSAGFVNSIQFRSGLMSDEEIKALGTATAAGIPAPQAGVNVSVTRSGNNLTLTWTGGTGPFKVQRKNALTDATWTDVTTTSERTASVPIQGTTGFFRITE